MASHYLNFLPLEIQTSIAELRSLGTPDRMLDLLIERIFKAGETKTTSLQMDIVRIEDSINARLERIGVKLGADLQSQLGATNDMLVDIRTSVQNHEAATHQLRAEFQTFGESVSGRVDDLEGWRATVDGTLNSFRKNHDESTAQRARTEHAVNELTTQFERFVAEIQALIAQGPTLAETASYRALLDKLRAEHEAAQ